MVIYLICKLIDLYCFILFIYVLMSWIPSSNSTFVKIHDALGRVCEPFLGLFRKVIPPMGGLDFSPVVAIIALELVVRLIAFIF